MSELSKGGEGGEEGGGGKVEVSWEGVGWPNLENKIPSRANRAVPGRAERCRGSRREVCFGSGAVWVE